MKYIAYAFFSMVVGVVVAFFAINSGLLRDYIQKEVRSKTGLAVEIGSLRLEPKWPLTLTVGPSKIPGPHVNMEIKGARVAVARLSTPYDIRVELVEPKIQLNGPLASFSTAPKSAAPGGAVGGANSQPGKFALTLNVRNGEFRAQDLGVTALNVDFEQKLWMSAKAPARLNVSARVQTQYLPGTWPISLQSDSLALSEESIKAQSVKATFAGLLASVQGTSLLNQGRHRWIAEIKAPDLKALPKPPFEIPASEWQGSIELRAEIVKDGANAAWGASGNARAQGLKARVKWQKEKLLIDGPTAVELNGKFTYQNQKFSLPELNAVVDLTAANFINGEIVNKPPNVPLKVEAAITGDSQNMDLKKIEVQFWQLKAGVIGSVSMQAPYPGRLSIEIPATSLKGLEAVLLPLKKSPVQGEAALQAEYEGPLSDPWGSMIRIKKLSVKSFSADVTYEGGGSVQARGPVTASVEVHGELDKGVPKAFQGSGNLQLTGLALVAGPLRKEPKQPLAASFNIKTEGQALQLEPLAIKGFLGDVRVSGRVSDPKRPKVALRIESKPLDLSELRVAMPAHREQIPKGAINGRLTLNGEFALDQAWHQWPLQVSGDLKVNLPEYFILSAAEAAVGDTSGAVAQTAPAQAQAPAPAPAPEVTGFLPRGPLTEKLNLQIAADIGLLRKEGLTIKGLSTSGRIFNGRFAGSVAMAEIFGGKVQLTKLDVPLLDPLPTIQGQAALEQLIVQDLLAFAKPEYKTMATGRARGEITFSTHLPADARFMDELKSKGRITLEPITLNTVKIGQLLNDLIAKIPGVKLPPAKVDPLKGLVQLDYQLAAQTMALAPLFARDEDLSELELKGKIVVPTMNGDLVGSFLWANSGVKGCLLDGNADAKGRLVVPVAVKGNLMQPQLSMVSDTAGKLAGHALECEKKKLIEKVKADGGESLRKEGEKILKGILGR